MGIKITELPSTAVNNADYIPVASNANGTRKVLMEDVLNQANPPLDSALSLTSNNAVKNKAIATAVNTISVGLANAQNDIDDLKSTIAQGSGLTDEAKEALLACFANVAWIGDDGQDYYDALEAALYPPVDLVSISAVYTQSGTVYDTDSLDSLKSDLVVTATYSDSSTAVVTAYTLSGTLTEGTSTITVSYGGKTTTFTVTVTHDDSILGYVSDNAIMILDGYANGTSGSHASTISSLIDQTGNGYDWEASAGTVTATDTALVFNGSSDLKPTWTGAMTTPNTIEVCIEVTSPSTTQCVVCGLALAEGTSDTAMGTLGVKSSYLLHKTGSTVGCLPITTGVHTYTFVNNNGTWSGYIDGELTSFGSVTVSWKTGYKRLGSFIGATGTGTPNNRLTGSIYSLRYYSDALTSDEISANYANDVLRFGLGA